MPRISATLLWRAFTLFLLVSSGAVARAEWHAGPVVRQFPAQPYHSLSREDEIVGLFKVPLPLVGRITGLGFRGAAADGGQFPNLTQHALFVDFKLPWSWTGGTGMYAETRLTAEFGEFSDGDDNRLFGSLGPAIRLGNDDWRVPAYIDAGLSPTIINGSIYGENDLGTSLNFTSYLTLGLRFGRHARNRISMRYQHISNGGINSTNPGVNMIGLDIQLWTR